MPTAAIAKFIEETEFPQLPKETIESAKKCILDTLGVTFAGSRENAGIIAAEYVKEFGGKSESGVISKGFKTIAPHAAFVNGIMAHVLDYDDYSVSWGPGHPAVVLLPAILALGEAKGISGKECLTAYVVGWEVGARVDKGVGGKLLPRGWHPTPLLGSLGAAAACSKFLKLNSEQIRSALGIAASEAGGLRLNFGTDTKSFHAGNAARNGITAALLAQKGFTANKNILEHSPLGFCEVMTGKKCEEKEMIQGLGKKFVLGSLVGESIKPYPSCGLTHQLIDGVLEINSENKIDPQKVSEIIAEVPPFLAQPLIYHSPKTGLEAKFSLEYCLAAALLDRDVKLKQFEEERVNRSPVRELMEKVKYKILSEVPSDKNAIGLPQKVIIKLKDGRSFSKEVVFSKGTPRNPMSFDEVVSKFKDCASLAISSQAIERIMAIVRDLEKEKDLKELMQWATFGKGNK